MLVKRAVKKRDNNKCQKCGKEVKGSSCHASHVIPVSKDGRLAYDIQNMKVMCYGCHLQWWHLHPVEAGQWFKDTFPERWEYLERKHKENQKLGSIQTEFYIEIIEEYG